MFPAWLHILSIAALVVGGVVWLPGALGGKGTPSAARTAQAASAYQQDRPLPTGLSTTRKATVDPQAGTVALSITYAAQAATLIAHYNEVWRTLTIPGNPLQVKPTETILHAWQQN